PSTSSNMHCILKLLALSFLSAAIAQKKQQTEIQFLNKLLRSIRKEREVQMIFMLQHHRARNCLIEDWNPRGIPIIRSDELSTFELRKRFNTFNTLAMLCITKSSHYKLLNNLAPAFNHMRQARIILWMQVRASEKMLRKICSLADGHSYIDILILEAMGNETVNAYRLNAFPNPNFERIKDILNSTEYSHNRKVNFQGKTAIVRHSRHSYIKVNVSYGPTGSFAIARAEDRQIIEFALRKNLSLKHNSRDYSDYFDIELSSRLLFQRNIEEIVNPFNIISMIVIVPCGKERSILDVFKQLDIATWLLHILVVYVAFVVVECLIRIVIHRITGRAHRAGILNPLMNLQAFAAILGMSFPVHRRWSPLLRQLFLVLSIFGFVFSNFFACKLSALLTKHSLYAPVQNFEELRLSGLTVVLDHEQRAYIVDYVDSEFFNRVITTSISLSNFDRTRMLASFNDSFGYVIIEENWPVFEQYQRFMGRKVFCHAKNLTIISSIPIMHTLPKNSIYKAPLKEFVHRVYESGIQKHWKIVSPQILRNVLNVTIKPFVSRGPMPLSLHHFNWLWPLIIVGYGIAIVVFLFEILLGKRCKKRNQSGTDI
ncbi:hypothetical protein KR054_005472, partial [Drosophila jambulina]